MALGDRIKIAEGKTNESPTEGQKRAGNYKKGKLIIKGIKIAVENPIGSIRSGVSNDGQVWENIVQNTYGYFSNTLGKDGDPVDVYLGSNIEDGSIFIIDQVYSGTKIFDEHKVMFGFNSIDEASLAYKANFNDGWDGLGNITKIDFNTFKSWLYNRKMTSIPFSKMKSKLGSKAVSLSSDIKHVKMIGEVIEDETLLDIKKQAGDESLFNTLVMEIASPGGSVVEGLKVMLWLESLAAKGKRVVTAVSANAYSIASLIMLVAHHRIISVHGKVMVHNPMLPSLEFVNADDLETHVDELRKLESLMRNLYMVFTGLDENTVESMMKRETFMTPQDAVTYRFADEIVEMNKKPYTVASQQHAVKHKIKNMSKAINILNRVIALVDGSDFVNQVYSTQAGPDIEIYQNDPSTYAVQDRTNIEQGVFTLADGATITVEGYLITDVQHGSEEAPEIEVEVEITPATPAAVEEEVAPMAEFNEGSAPKVEDPAMVEVAPEVEPMVNMDPIVPEPIQPVQPVQIDPLTPIVQAPGEKEELINMVKEMQSTISGLQKKIAELVQEKVEASVSSLDSKMTAVLNRVVNIEKFNDTAAETIETLAQNTVSQFKPSKKASAVVSATGSIFQQAKAKAGL